MRARGRDGNANLFKPRKSPLAPSLPLSLSFYVSLQFQTDVSRRLAFPGKRRRRSRGHTTGAASKTGNYTARRYSGTPTIRSDRSLNSYCRRVYVYKGLSGITKLNNSTASYRRKISKDAEICTYAKKCEMH